MSFFQILSQSINVTAVRLILLLRVIYQGALTRNLLEERDFQFVYLYSLLSNTIFIREQNG
jgi:hypothetical protein